MSQTHAVRRAVTTGYCNVSTFHRAHMGTRSPPCDLQDAIPRILISNMFVYYTRMSLANSVLAHDKPSSGNNPSVK
jgi:hypothetical protein